MKSKNLEDRCDNVRIAENNLKILIKGFPLRDYIKLDNDCYDCKGYKNGECKFFRY